MIKVVEVETEQNNETVVKQFQLDEILLDGLYLTHDDKKIDHNIKKFKITKPKVEILGHPRVMFTKCEAVTVVTIHFKEYGFSKYAQFLVGKNINNMDILDCEHGSIAGIKDVLMNAADMARMVTMQDLLDNKYFKQNND